MSAIDYITIRGERYLKLASVVNWLTDYSHRLGEAGGETYPVDNLTAALLEIELRHEG